MHTLGVLCRSAGAVSNEVLRLLFEGADGSSIFTDATGRHAPTFVGSPTLSTGQYVGGASSVYFPAEHSIIECAGVSPTTSTDFVFDGDFSIRFSARFNSVSSVSPVHCGATKTYGFNGSTSRFSVLVVSGNLLLKTNSNQTVISGGSITANAWHEIEVRRVGSTVSLIKNGGVMGTYESTSTWGAGGVFIGNDTSASMNGYIDSFVVTKG